MQWWSCPWQTPPRQWHYMLLVSRKRYALMVVPCKNRDSMPSIVHCADRRADGHWGNHLLRPFLSAAITAGPSLLASMRTTAADGINHSMTYSHDKSALTRPSPPAAPPPWPALYLNQGS